MEERKMYKVTGERKLIAERVAILGINWVALGHLQSAPSEHGFDGHKLAFIRIISSSILQNKICYPEWSLRVLQNDMPTLSATLRHADFIRDITPNRTRLRLPPEHQKLHFDFTAKNGKGTKKQSYVHLD
jgi:hypothetical protein